MTVVEFCLRKTQVQELCVIREDGWIVSTVWIDHEDLFAIHPRFKNKKIKSDKWGTLPITTDHGDTLEIPCHHIDC